MNINQIFVVAIGGVMLKTYDNSGDLMSPVSYEAVVHPLPPSMEPLVPTLAPRLVHAWLPVWLGTLSW